MFIIDVLLLSFDSDFPNRLLIPGTRLALISFSSCDGLSLEAERALKREPQLWL